MFLAFLLAAAQVTAAAPMLDIDARLVIRDQDQLLTFTIKNDSSVATTFDEARSPCAPNELVTIVFIGRGGIGRFVERNPLIADSFSRMRTLLPHQEYECNFNVSHWFYGKLPENHNALLLWSFQPEMQGVFKQSLYGGAFFLHTKS